LLVLDSDSRMSVTIVDPRGRQWPLAYDRVITPHFTSLGPEAQWRILEGTSGLMALAVRVNANEDPESSDVTSYWAVARVAPTGSCVTDRVDAGPDESRRLDAAMEGMGQKPCLQAQ
jgi:hypothetical protein